MLRFVMGHAPGTVGWKKADHPYAPKHALLLNTGGPHWSMTFTNGYALSVVPVTAIGVCGEQVKSLLVPLDVVLAAHKAYSGTPSNLLANPRWANVEYHTLTRMWTVVYTDNKGVEKRSSFDGLPDYSGTGFPDIACVGKMHSLVPLPSKAVVVTLTVDRLREVLDTVEPDKDGSINLIVPNPIGNSDWRAVIVANVDTFCVSDAPAYSILMPRKVVESEEWSDHWLTSVADNHDRVIDLWLGLEPNAYLSNRHTQNGNPIPAFVEREPDVQWVAAKQCPRRPNCGLVAGFGEHGDKQAALNFTVKRPAAWDVAAGKVQPR